MLVLNRLYVAVRVISARRAFCLLMNSVAEIIHVRREGESEQFETHDFASWLEASQFKAAHEHERYDWVRTVRYEVPVPRVIRLLGYDRLPEQIVKLNRRNLFARDRNQCQYCGRHFPTADLSIDHVVPRMQGGPDSWENLVCACIRCTRAGGARPAGEHEADQTSREAQAQPADHAAPRAREVLELEELPRRSVLNGGAALRGRASGQWPIASGRSGHGLPATGYWPFPLTSP